MKKLLCLLLAAALVLSLCACEAARDIISEYSSAAEAGSAAESESKPSVPAEEPQIDEDGSYFSKDEVALYIHIYGKLPQNFITKAKAKELGWEGGSVEKYAEGKAIGGDRFGNYEGLLPEADERKYTECDINTNGKSARGAERIIFSDDGFVYYTADHYESFELLYGG